MFTAFFKNFSYFIIFSKRIYAPYKFYCLIISGGYFFCILFYAFGHRLKHHVKIKAFLTYHTEKHSHAVCIAQHTDAAFDVYSVVTVDYSRYLFIVFFCYHHFITLLQFIIFLEFWVGFFGVQGLFQFIWERF
jgi:hypothetical protein